MVKFIFFLRSFEREKLCNLLVIGQQYRLHQGCQVLRAKFNSGRTQKTKLLHCFGLTILKIKGETFLIAFFLSKKEGKGTHICQY